MKSISKKIDLPDKSIESTELALLLNVLAKQHYHTTLPKLLRQLDKVSGNLSDLVSVYEGDIKKTWTQAEDALLYQQQGLLVRWKGRGSVEERKRYLEFGKDDENSSEERKEARKVKKEQE